MDKNKKAFRRVIKAWWKNEQRRRSRGIGDQYSVSLMEKPRKMADPSNDEGWLEYGIYELDEEQSGMSDDELDREIWDTFKIPFRYEAWDCTGKPFTSGIHWHRNPCGFISVIHHIGIDC